MKLALPVLVFGASIATASFLSSHGGSRHGRLVIRQDDSEPVDGTSFGPCQSECTDFLNLSVKCSDGDDDSNGQDLSEAEAAKRYQCICTDQFVPAVTKCGACAPQDFAGATGDSIDSFLQTAAFYCKDAGYPIDIGAAATSKSSSTDLNASAVASGSGSQAAGSPLSSAANTLASNAVPSASSAASPAQASDSAAGAAVRTEMISGLTMLVVGVGLLFYL